MTLHPPHHTIPVSLRRLLPTASFAGCADVVATAVTEHSRNCVPGCLFAAIPGGQRHGREFAQDAVARGAAAILTDRPLAELAIPQCVVNDVRKSFAELCHALHGYPTRRLGTAGVTGTNGKTTTTWLIRALLESAGRTAGLLGTIEYSDGLTRERAGLTTPDSETFARWLGSMTAGGTRYAALELSSHALDQNRCAGTQLDVAVVTNVTHDHLDYHCDLAAYASAKSRIMTLLKRGGLLLVNADDPLSCSFAELAPPHAQVQSFGIDSPASLEAHIFEQTNRGTRFVLRAGAVHREFETSLIGRHNVSNCLAAIGAALHFGLSLDEIASGLHAATPAPGRLEPVDCGQDFALFVDYAHTPDALSRAIATLREITPGRVFCVFGAGGDRDRAKRPEMGRAAAAADVAVVTSDNPRSERPETIIDEIATGLSAAGAAAHIEPDREQAIHWAIAAAQTGDTIIVAGKGHERVQIIGDRRIPFDDRAVCRQWLLRRGESSGREARSPVGA